MARLLVDTTPLKVSPAFRRLWWGLGVSNFGAQMTVIAIGLEVYDISGSTFMVGMLGLCALIPLVALGLYGGALVDSHDRRKVALLSSLVLWICTLALAAQAWAGVRSIPVLFAVVAIQSAAFAVNNPARSAIIPRLVGLELLPAANVLYTVLINVALTVGPMAGALLVAWGGYEFAYTVDALLFTFALWAVYSLPSMPPDTSGQPRKAGWASIAEGLKFLGTRPNIRMTFFVDLAAMILAMPRVLFPAVGVIIIGGGETTTGLLSAAFAIGAVVAGLLSGGLARFHYQGRIIVWAIMGWGLSIIAFGGVLMMAGRTEPSQVLTWALVAACVTLMFAGASDAVSAVFRTTILQAATPDHLRGRLQGIFIVVVAGGPRLGDLFGGGVASLTTEAWAAIIGGIACIITVIALTVKNSGFWAYDSRNPQP